MNTVCVATFLFSVSSVFGHICLLNPLQRGSISGLNEPASNDCLLLESPCGGRPAKSSGVIALAGNSNITVIFQKNLDHWLKTSPGYFSISFGQDDDPSTFKEVVSMPDDGSPSLTLYTVQVTLPSRSIHPLQTLQVRYVPKNPDVPATFYQCADIMIR